MLTTTPLDPYKALNRPSFPWTRAMTWAVILAAVLALTAIYTWSLRVVMQDAYQSGIVAGAALRDAQTGPLLYRLREIEMGHQRQIWAGDSLTGWWPVP